MGDTTTSGIKIPSWIIPTFVVLSVIVVIFLIKGVASDQARVLDAANLETINRHIDRNEDIDTKAALAIQKLQTNYKNLSDDVIEIKTTGQENQRVLFRLAVKMGVNVD